MNTKHAWLVATLALIAASQAVFANGLREEMETANAQWLTAFNTMNGAAFPAMYTKDAICLPPDLPPVVGAEAIGQFWADRIKGGTRRNHTFEIVSIRQDGKLAYQVARWTADLVNENGEITKLKGNTVRIFERQANGKWLTRVHIYNRL